MPSPASQVADLPNTLLELVTLPISFGISFVRYLGAHQARVAENLFLRRHLALFLEREKRPGRPDNGTRLWMVLLSRFFNWRDSLVVVRPQTLIRWHRQAFKLLWRWKSRTGRKPIPLKLRRLIAKMATDNPLWGEERIAAELLLKTGIRLSPRTVGKYMPKKPPNERRGT